MFLHNAPKLQKLLYIINKNPFFYYELTQLNITTKKICGLIGKYDKRGANGIRETGTDYGFQAMPEIGFGIKLKRNMAVDFSVKFCTAYMTGDWWWNRAMLCIGFRF